MYPAGRGLQEQRESVCVRERETGEGGEERLRE